jgi:hypothetical protein
VVASTASELGEHDGEHLHDGAPDLLGQCLSWLAPGTGAAALGDPFGHEGVDVSRQLLHGSSAASLSELAEPDQNRDTRLDVPGAITALGHPDDVTLDLRADP